MKATVVLAALVLLCACPGAVLAILEDQAGQYDWLQQYVGRVKLAQLATTPRPRLYVASEAGALAALSPTDGSLLWRKVLAEGDTFTHLLVLGTRVVTLSDGGRQLLAWDAATGGAVWAATVATGAELAGGVDLAAVGSKAVAVAVGGTVKAFAVTDGRELWTASLDGGSAQLFAAADGGVWAASLPSGGSQLALASLSADGQVSQQPSLAADGGQLTGAQLAVGEAGVAALSADGSSLCAAAQSALACQGLAALVPAGVSVAGARLVPGSCSAHAVLQVAGGAAVLALGGSSGASMVKFVPDATASGCFLGQGADATPLVALATPSTAGLRVQVVSAADGSSVQEAALPSLAPQLVTSHAVGVAALFAAPSSGTFRQLVVFDDDSLALVEGGALAWLRHEELASVTDVLFTDLPAPTPENEAQWLASQPGLAETLRAQALTLKVQAGQLANLALASPEERREVERYKAVTNDKLRPTRDPDGFRKQLVVLTASGKVMALHTGDGRLLWSLDFGRGAAMSKLGLWRVPHEVQHDVEVVAFDVGVAATAAIINAHTGAILDTLAAPVAAADLLHLPQAAHDGTADQHVYALVPAGEGGEPQLLPDTALGRAAFAAARPTLSFWRADEQAGTIRGLGFTESGAVEERWSAVLAPAGSGRRILAVAAHLPGETVYSPARVLGNGELKFKYLNPNTLLVAVGPPAGGRGEQTLTVALLDAVTGRTLFSQAHEGASGPVHAVLTENMAAYHFWSSEAHRWQMATVELYDASPPTLKVSDLAFGETNLTSSSWDVPPLEAGSQTFLCRLPVVGLSVTRSLRGNTAKQVMLLTQAGQVYLLDRRFLDPRRPIVPPGQKPTPEQAAEQLPAYQAELPLSGPMFATLNHEVKRLRGVAVEAAELESTMLMLGHGLDLFYTRLTPSKSFDMVPDDFPYALLVLIVVSLTTATVVLSFLQSKGTMKAKWQ